MRNNPKKAMKSDALILGDIGYQGDRGLIAAATWRIEHYPKKLMGWARSLENGLFLECHSPEPERGKYHNMSNVFVGWRCLYLHTASPDNHTLNMRAEGQVGKLGFKTIPIKLHTLPNGFSHHRKLNISYGLNGFGTFDQWWMLLTVVNPLVSYPLPGFGIEDLDEY